MSARLVMICALGLMALPLSTAIRSDVEGHHERVPDNWEDLAVEAEDVDEAGKEVIEEDVSTADPSGEEFDDVAEAVKEVVEDVTAEVSNTGPSALLQRKDQLDDDDPALSPEAVETATDAPIEEVQTAIEEVAATDAPIEEAETFDEVESHPIEEDEVETATETPAEVVETATDAPIEEGDRFGKNKLKKVAVNEAPTAATAAPSEDRWGRNKLKKVTPPSDVATGDSEDSEDTNKDLFGRNNLKKTNQPSTGGDSQESDDTEKDLFGRNKLKNKQRPEFVEEKKDFNTGLCVQWKKKNGGVCEDHVRAKCPVTCA